VGDLLQAGLIGYYATDSHSGEKEEYARFLNESTAYTPRQFTREILSVEEPASKEQEKRPSKVELKPLPSHLRYEFLDSAHQFPVIVSAKLDGPIWKNCWMCSGSIGVPLAIVLMISRDLVLHSACIISFLMKFIAPLDNLCAI